MTTAPLVQYWQGHRRELLRGFLGAFAVSAALLLVGSWPRWFAALCGAVMVVSAPLVIWQSLRWDKQFTVAWILLLVTAIGWSAAQDLLGFVTQKSPVPWPAPVAFVTEDDHRMTSLPAEMGNYRLAKDSKGELLDLDWGKSKSGRSTLDSLGMATDWDRSGGRRESRCCNWYVTRVYEDTRSQRKLAWNLAIYYYTGGLDLVPHIPENCLEAGGNKVVSSDRVKLVVPAVKRFGWNEVLTLSRTQYRSAKDGRQFVEYYLFSLNGQPEHSNLDVRWNLMNPFTRHTYFAKIQFGARLPMTTVQESDRQAEEFLQATLPEILRFLPSQQDVDKLNKGK